MTPGNPIVPIASVCIAFSVATLSTASGTTVDSFRIRQLYSNQDGDYQFIELEEIGGKDDQNRFAGLALSVSNVRGDVTKTFVFPANLPSATTANRHVLVVSEAHAAAGANHDFVMPNRFLPTDGGTIDFAGIDHWIFNAIPHGGEIYRDEHPVRRGIAQTFDGGLLARCWGGGSTMREYYNAALDRYFISSTEPDIDAPESGRIARLAATGNGIHRMDHRYSGRRFPISRAIAGLSILHSSCIVNAG